ncbi:MAG: biotin transporter BioY [Actinomycetota bacterium]|nr:biotin transporter BioY [Actinomycetota bacterium]
MSTLAETIAAKPRARSSVITDVSLVVLGSLVVAGFAQISIHLGFTPVPITGQTLGVLLVGGALGAWRGGAALALYLLEGALGAPFFASGTHGVSLLKASSATGGYLWGFVVAAIVIGWLAERRSDRKVVSALGTFFLGEAIIFTFGVAWLAHAIGVSGQIAVEKGLYPFVVGDAIKVGIAALALPAAWRFTRKS